MKRMRIGVTGIVQGVGFRPFVYNLARRFALAGWVQNIGSGVIIEIEGVPFAVESFVQALKTEVPPVAVLEEIWADPCELKGESDFIIRKSEAKAERQVFVSPDVATCADCQREITDPKDRRYRYPFTNCTNCGPRYTIITGTPYDREQTTMAEFTMCSTCREEYQDPSNRRFHAQPNACPECGPSYRLFNEQKEIQSGEPIETARQLIADGAIVAMKGIGGYHLVCNAQDDKAVSRMRRRKLREDKPFAVMGGSLDILKRHCVVTKEEAQLLTGSVKPIVLVKKSAEYSLAEAVAPGNPYLGVMLPYAPVHYFLLRPEDILVMTSGNISDEPIVYEDDDAFDRLSTIADYFLVHNRRIYCRADDSVCRTFQEKPYWLRRGRGLAPAPIKLATSGPKILACGGELKNTFCLTADNMAFISAHTGDLENQATYNSYRDSIRHYQEMLNITPELVACDLHPGYLSTQYARELGLPVVGVQHHHAHIAAVLAEHGMDEKVIGVAFDGTGYGTDGNIWGGEFFLADCSDYIRLAHCAYLKLPGGARAIQEPWRLAAWQLYSLYGPDFINRAVPLTSRLQEGWQLVLQAAEKGINTPLSAGAGRLFDIAAAILGIRTHIHYEGQAAVELELAAAGIQGKALPYQIQGGTPLELDFSPAFEALVNRMEAGADYRSLAADFHATVAAAMIETVGRLGRMTGVNKVVLSGGVFQNVTLLSLVVTQLEKDFIVLLPKMVPPNDGGLSLGQIAVARKRSEGRCV